MGRLTPYVSLAAGVAIPGALVILVLAFGFYNVPAILGAVIVGAVLVWPVSHWASRKIKREDPEWDARRERPQTAPPGEKPELF